MKHFDYSQNGVYFITICTKNKKVLFWNVGAAFGRPHQCPLSKYGHIVDAEIDKIESIYEGSVIVTNYVIMPNHVHLLLLLQNEVNGRPKAAPTILRIINQMKGSVSKQIGFSVWQKLFHDHIIRNKDEYLKVWQYIDDNPLKRAEDVYHTT